MGRFGEVLLVNGETDLSLDARLGEVVRLYFTNTANTRTFKVALPGAHEARRRRQRPRRARGVRRGRRPRALRARGRGRPVRQAGRPDARAPDAGARLPAGRHPRERRADRAFVCGAVRSPPHERRHGRRARADRPYLDAEPDKTLGFIAEMDMEAPEGLSSTPARCTPKSSATSRAAALVQDEALGGRGAERRLRVSHASRGRERRARPLPSAR